MRAIGVSYLLTKNKKCQTRNVTELDTQRCLGCFVANLIVEIVPPVVVLFSP